MEGTGVSFSAATDELAERDHEMRAALFGIQAVARALYESRDRLRSADVDQLALAIESEVRRLHLMLEPRPKQTTVFDLGDAILPAIIMVSALGVVVRNTVPVGTWVRGNREDTAQVVLAVLDNARIHAQSEIDVSVRSRGGFSRLWIEDRGPGMPPTTRRAMFKRGRHSAQSPGSGLGLFIGERLMAEQGGLLSAAPRPGGGTPFVLQLPTEIVSSSEEHPQVVTQPAAVR